VANLKNIKSKIRAVGKTRQVTKAMEAVSAAKMRKAQAQALGGRAYARAAVSILARLAGSKMLATHPLTRGSEAVASVLYIVITADRGLAGSLNSAVLKAAAADLRALGLPKEKVEIIAIGKKAHDFFERRGFTIALSFANTGEADAAALGQIVMSAVNRFAEGAFDAVKVVHQNFVSTFEQRPEVRTILPLQLEALETVVAGIVPARGKFADLSAGEAPATYEFEPSEEEVLGAILPRLAAIFVHHALLEAQASEHSARMVAMKSASDKASEMAHTLTIRYNKARQAAITREVSEITGGMEALAN
jgi:F-type H+-transporting ATPase subunit gamma